VPDEPHLVDLLVDQRDPAVTDLRADVDLFQRSSRQLVLKILTVAGQSRP